MFNNYSTKCIFLAVTILSVFVLNNGFAQERVFQYVDPPSEVTISDPKTGDWILKAQLKEGICEEQNTPTVPLTTGCYTLNVTQKGSECQSNGLNAIEILTDDPDNCTKPLGYTFNIPDFKDGAYIRGVKHMLLKEWDSSSGDCNYQIGMSGSQSLVHGTVCIKLGKVWQCEELAVPGCFNPECYTLPTGVQTPTNDAECWDLSNRNLEIPEIISVSIKRITATTYADWLNGGVVWHPGSPNCDSELPTPATITPIDTDQGCWQGANQKKECVRKDHQSPGCFWFYSGGYYSQYCY